MNLIKNLHIKYSKFIRFCIVGGINTILSLIVYTALLHVGTHYILSSIIGYICGILNGYLLSSRYVFGEKISGKKGVKFVSVYLSALIINLCIITILIEYLLINAILAQIIATTFNVVYNYIINNIWTFKNK